MLFTVEQREQLNTRLLEMARRDPRVASAAVVGSRAGGGGDHWSDLDLSFGLAAGASVPGVLGDWTHTMEAEFGAVRLFDLPYLSSVYRVFLLPGSLQVDLSFTPGAEFGSLGPRFELLFGTAIDRGEPPPPAAAMLLGLGAHHAVRARFCIERDRPLQAEYWLSGARDQALALACLRLGLESRNARGYDGLPPAIRDAFGGALVRATDATELRRALGCTIELLAGEAALAGAESANIERSLRELAGS